MVEARVPWWANRSACANSLPRMISQRRSRARSGDDATASIIAGAPIRRAVAVRHAGEAAGELSVGAGRRVFLRGRGWSSVIPRLVRQGIRGPIPPALILPDQR